MANILRGLLPVTLTVTGYTASSESSRVAVTSSVADLTGSAVSQVTVQGEASAQITVRFYDAAASGVCRAEMDVTLDSSGRGGVAVAAAAVVAGWWYTIEADTSGNYTIVAQFQPPTLGT